MAHVEHVDRRSTIERSKLQQQVGPKMPIFGAGKMRQNAMPVPADSAPAGMACQWHDEASGHEVTECRIFPTL